MEDKFKKTVEMPAEVLEQSISGYHIIAKKIMKNRYMKRSQNYWQSLGPGLTTGASDDDPSGIATYSQTGAQYGFQLLWLSAFTFPLMSIVQEMCARIGVVTGKGLAANIRIFYPRWILYVVTFLLFVANTFNIGADIGAMAKGMQLLFPHLNFVFLVISFALLGLGLQIFMSYKIYAKYLKWLAFILLAYVFSALSIKLDWGKVLSSAVIPSVTFSKEQLVLICAILGTTISPYLFFWQTSQEVEEHREREGHAHILAHHHTGEHDAKILTKDIKRMRTDVWTGMFFSNVVMFFIIAACAATLHIAGITNIATAADAAAALKPIAGEQAYLLFALGIIGTGMLAIPVLAGSASYAIAESFGWKDGLYRKLKDASAFYGIIIISTLVGVGLNFVGIDPIKALIYSAVANGLVAPIVLILIVMMSSSKKVMGDRTNHPIIAILGWIITGIMTIAGIAAIISLFI
jgi:NRAMP (natural resistance-associated macrophage protein)-like metal ion transporter